MLFNRYSDPDYLEGLYRTRNKDYGSYQIITTFERRLKWSFLVSTAVFLLFIVGYLTIDFSVNEEVFFQGDSYVLEAMLADFQTLPAPADPKPPLKAVKSQNEQFAISETDEAKIKQTPTEVLKPDSTTTADQLAAKGNTGNAAKGDSAGADQLFYMSVDKLPEFPGGEKALSAFLSQKLKYPISLQQQKITGVVKVTFIVEKDGSVSHVKLLQSVHPLLDSQVMKIVTDFTGWKPAYRQGKPVRFFVTLPVRFAPEIVWKK